MEDKKTLITIIVLLAFFLPLSILGTVSHFKLGVKNSIKDDNPNKEIFFNNSVYFYQGDELIDTYKCNNKCELVKADASNEEYIHYAKNLEEVPFEIDPLWKVFKDGSEIKVYNMMGKSVALNLEEIKVYENANLLIGKSDGKWGANLLDLSGSVPYMYDYLDIPKHYKENTLSTDKFIAKKGGTWLVLKIDEETGEAEEYINSTDKIVDFNDSYFITYNDGYHIKDYEGNELFESLNKNNVYAIDKYLFLEINGNLMVVEDKEFIQPEGVPVKLPEEYENIYFNIVEDNIEIVIDNNSYQTIEIN